MRILLAVLLILSSLAFAAVGTYISLLSGLHPWLAGSSFVIWLALGAYCLRFVQQDETWGRVLLPAAFLMASLVLYNYGLKELLRRHYEKVGYPRRYYQWTPAK